MPDTNQPFDLHTVVRDVLEAATSPDPTVIAGQVLARIKAADRKAALSQSLRVFVHHQMTNERATRVNAPSSDDGEDVSDPPKVGVPFHQRTRLRVSFYERLLRSAEFDEETREWFFLGDATTDRLDRLAGAREALAAANAAKAERFRRLEKVLAESGVGTVRELPEGVVLEAWGVDR